MNFTVKAVASAIFNTVRRSCLTDLPPEPQVGDQKPAGHDGHAAAPDAPEGFRAGDPAGIDRGGLSADIHHHAAFRLKNGQACA